MPLPEVNPASFRDPSGFVFKYEDVIYRAIAPSYNKNYNLFIQSGLCKYLTEKKAIIPHIEVKDILLPDFPQHQIIKPEQIPFISYPYEWCFSQLKSAALLTLQIQKVSLKYGMSLKDASAYNVQFIGCRPTFIDTLSFEKYIENHPWIAYKQFCQHFLAPLALMSYRSTDLIKLHLNYSEGIPLELASSLLPKRSMLNSGIASHIILHAKFQKKNTTSQKGNSKLSKSGLMAMIEHLEACISSLKLPSKKSSWSEYSLNNTYSKEATHTKEQAITKWLEHKKYRYIYDFGCNTGNYSLLAAKYCENVLSIDSDHNCIEKFYQQNKNNTQILPLVINLSAPSPASGWDNKEHSAIKERGSADVLLALALIHHLRISNNVPLSKIADYFYNTGNMLIIEFIPKNDPMIQQMLLARKDIFEDYSLDSFIHVFEERFIIKDKVELASNGRILFFMTKKHMK